jgi:hypothetical protein
MKQNLHYNVKIGDLFFSKINTKRWWLVLNKKDEEFEYVSSENWDCRITTATFQWPEKDWFRIR